MAVIKDASETEQVIFGLAYNEELQEMLRVTVIATGFNSYHDSPRSGAANPIDDIFHRDYPSASSSSRPSRQHFNPSRQQPSSYTESTSRPGTEPPQTKDFPQRNLDENPDEVLDIPAFLRVQNSKDKEVIVGKMKPNLRQTYAELLNQERRHHHSFRKRIRSVLVYPGAYELGMSNLGVQVIYSTLNRRDDTSCERAFLPHPQLLSQLRQSRTPLFSFETQTPLNQFNLLGFSVSFESDYVNIPLALELAHIPSLAADRTDQDPLIIAGGINISYNPEPITDFVDIFVVGEAEITIHRMMDCFSEWNETGNGKADLLHSLVTIPGFYVPKFYQVDYRDDGTIERTRAEASAPEKIRASAVANLDDVETCTQIHTPNTEFSKRTSD